MKLGATEASVETKTLQRQSGDQRGSWGFAPVRAATGRAPGRAGSREAWGEAGPAVRRTASPRPGELPSLSPASPNCEMVTRAPPSWGHCKDDVAQYRLAHTKL